MLQCAETAGELSDMKSMDLVELHSHLTRLEQATILSSLMTAFVNACPCLHLWEPVKVSKAGPTKMIQTLYLDPTYADLEN